MAKTYTPGLKVSPSTRHRTRRLLPIAGDVLVTMGTRVDAQQVVAQTFMPGPITPLNMAKLLAIPPADVPDCMLKKEGDHIASGEPAARTKGIFGRFRTEYMSTVTGTIESISSITGQVLVRGESQPLQVKAYLSGTVVEILPREGCVIEADATLIQGIFGIGGEAFGSIRVACQRHDQELSDDRLTPDMRGCVVVGGGRLTHQAIQKARGLGVSALVSGGMDDQDLRTFLGYDLGVAITGSEQLGLTVIITEGFGDIAMAERTFNLLVSREGAAAAVNGATQIRAGVMRPEIVIPLTGPPAPERPAAHAAGYLVVGMSVRVVRDPYFGRIGEVTALPLEPRVLESGSKARVLEVTFKSGEGVIIPRANVELIEE